MSGSQKYSMLKVLLSSPVALITWAETATIRSTTAW